MTDSSDNLGMASMKGVEPPEDGYEMAPGPTYTDPSMVGRKVGRDAQTDDRGMNDVGSGNIMDDRDLDDEGWMSNLNTTGLGDEARRAGWIPLATPVGGTPHPANVAGTRGAQDIGKIPVDDSMPTSDG